MYVCALQEAVAVGLELELSRLGEKDCYYKTLPAELLPKRNRMIKLLSDVGMIPTIPDGSYFIIADFSNLGMLLYALFIPVGCVPLQRRKEWFSLPTKWLVSNKNAFPLTLISKT